MKKDGKLLRVLSKEALPVPPVWLMRQAGRYLPEYRALREKVGSFWAMCTNPEMAAEITMQPIRRFGFDAAIIFSDILTVPFALGADVRFVEGEGPRLTPVRDMAALDSDVAAWRSRLMPAYETLSLVRGWLVDDTALLGFAGAPWTLATYLAAGRGGDDQLAAKLWFYRDPKSFEALLALLGDCVAQHLIWQFEAGADAVQIFDSWASNLPLPVFERVVVEPTKRIVETVRAARPDARIIGFPRAATLAGYKRYAEQTGVDAVSVDTAFPLDARKAVLEDRVLQGNLDPAALIAGGAALAGHVDRIVEQMQGTPFIFNLGHGVLPETPVENIAALLTQIRSRA